MVQERGGGLKPKGAASCSRESIGTELRRERLRKYAGWSIEDQEAFDAELRAQRRVDARSWNAVPPAHVSGSASASRRSRR